MSKRMYNYFREDEVIYSKNYFNEIYIFLLLLVFIYLLVSVDNDSMYFFLLISFVLVLYALFFAFSLKRHKKYRKIKFLLEDKIVLSDDNEVVFNELTECIIYSSLSLITFENQNETIIVSFYKITYRDETVQYLEDMSKRYNFMYKKTESYINKGEIKKAR